MTGFYDICDQYRQQEANQRAADAAVFRYDLATWNGPRLILITDLVGKRSTVPLLGTVVLPQRGR
jgi:hypothetical protein